MKCEKLVKNYIYDGSTKNSDKSDILRKNLIFIIMYNLCEKKVNGMNEISEECETQMV